MQRTIIGYSAGLFVLLALLFGIGFTSYAQSMGTIKGKVTGDGNLPLANVPVKAFYQEDFTGIIVWSYAGEATTDSTGVYTFSNLPEGIYHISFNEYLPLAGYFPEFYNNVSTQESGTDITLAAGATVNNINAKLSSGAHIKGKVTDLQGKPLSNIRVLVDSSDGFFNTGIDGLYEIGNLLAGSYRISFEDTRQLPIYRNEYFDNAKEAENATFVTLAAEQTLTNINAQLDRLGFITGRVTNEQNNPLQSIQLTAQRRMIRPEGEFWYDAGFAGTDTNGNYVLGGLYEGLYRIRFRDEASFNYSTEYYNNVYDPVAATPLTITLNHTTTNINAQLALRGGIAGIVTNVAGEPLSNITVVAESYFEREPGNIAWLPARTAQSDANGAYQLCCIDTMPHRIHFSDPAHVYMSEYYENVIYGDIYHIPDNFIRIVVTPGVTTTHINAQLSKFSSISGLVTDNRNNPISNISIWLYRYSSIDNGQWFPINSGLNYKDGLYEMGGITPGRYRLRFLDNVYPPRFKEKFFENAADVASATDITLTEQATVTANISLADTARITGRVIDPDGNPISNYTVSAYQLSMPPDDPSWNYAVSTKTDENGDYGLNNLYPTLYRVQFGLDPDGFIREYYNNVSSIEAATDIVVIDGKVVSNINAQVDRLNQIQGRVTDKANVPLSDIHVTIYRYQNTSNQQFMWQEYRYQQTDTDGRYSFLEMEPGLYRVWFQDPSMIHRSTFYDSAGSLENATIITLTANMTLTDINAQLPTNPFTLPPLAQDDQIVVAEGGVASSGSNGLLSVLANDRADSGNPLQANLATQPTHGTLTFNPDGTFSYTHNGDEATSDFFTYSANDGTQASNVAKVTITIQPVNDPPSANNDSATVARGQHTTKLDNGAKSLLANDSDPDSTILTATLVTGPVHGTVTINANGTFTYTHNGDNGATDGFTYQATDGFGSAAVATVTLAINPFRFSKTVGMAGIQPLCTPVDELHAPVGTTIVYCYTIHNVGDAPLTTHSLVDSHLGALLTNHTQTVAPGAVFSVTFTQTLTISTTNVATWTATSGAGQALSAAITPSTAKTAATVIIAGPTDDADQDTIPDNLEKAGDSDGDNLPNFLDTDTDGDGKLDKDEVGSNLGQPVDSDQDGLPDYLDAQSGALQQQLFLPVIKR